MKLQVVRDQNPGASLTMPQLSAFTTCSYITPSVYSPLLVSCTWMGKSVIPILASKE